MASRLEALLARQVPRDGWISAAAYTALVFALGGTAYAAATITGSDIVDGTITSADIGDLQIKTSDIGEMAVTENRLDYNAVTGVKVRSGSLLGSDIGDASLTGADILNESLTGDDIKDGSVTGQDLGITVETETSGSDEPEYVKTATAGCPWNKKAIAGGGEIVDVDPDRSPDGRVSLVASAPYDSGQSGSGWHVRGAVTRMPTVDKFIFAYDDGYVTGFDRYWGENSTYDGKWRLRVWVICASKTNIGT